jgi:hypothetical protein
MYYQLIVEKDVPIRVRDGTARCADVFRPNDVSHFPAIMTLGPYPKDIHFKAWAQGQSTASLFAGIEGIDSPYMHWETVSPNGGCRRDTQSFTATREAQENHPVRRIH